jgi:hypothetical protein
MSNSLRICILSVVVILCLGFSSALTSTAYSNSQSNGMASSASKSTAPTRILPSEPAKGGTKISSASPSNHDSASFIASTTSWSPDLWSSLPFTSHGVAVSGKSSYTVSSVGRTDAYLPTALSASNAESPAKSSGGGANPGDGYCFYGAGNCFDPTYNGGPVMHSAQFIIDVWPGVSNYGDCNGFHVFEPYGGNSADCHYIFLQELFLQDFCANPGGSLFTTLDQYTDGTGNGFSSCSLVGGSASESSSGFSVSYTWDSTPYPGNDCTGSAYSGLASCLSEADIYDSAIRADGGCSSLSGNCLVIVLTAYDEPQQGFYPVGGVVSYCAYHSWVKWSGNTLIFATEPDDYAAGSGCGLGLAGSPTGDPAGDLQVSPVMHETFESLTDPLLNAWYYENLQHEVMDQCAYDYVGTQSFDESNIHMGTSSFWDPDDVQSIWSNYNGGCTLDLNGAPTFLEITMTPDSYTGTTAQAWTFPLWFVEAGSVSFYTIISTSDSSYPGGSVVGVWQTPDYYSYVEPSCGGTCEASGTAFAFCMNYACDFQGYEDTANYGTTTNLAYYYYELLEQQPWMNVIDGGSPPVVGFSYDSAPTCGSSCQGGSDTISIQSVNLPTSPDADLFAIWYSTASVVTCDPSGYHSNGILDLPYCGTNLGNFPSERWDTGVCNSGIILEICYEEFTLEGEYWVGGISYYNQYLVETYYSTSDGSTPSVAPTLSYTSFGSASSVTLTTSANYAWADYGSSWSVPTNLQVSGATERWYNFGATTGTITGSISVTPTYTDQFLVTYISSPATAGTTKPSGYAWYDSGSVVAIIAKPASGWAFEDWTQSNSSGSAITFGAATGRSTTETVNGGGTVTANFEGKVSLTLSSSSGSVAPGSSLSITGTISGGPQSVTLAGKALPKKTTVSFTTNPITDSVSGVSDGITISAGLKTTPGTYVIKIEATGADGLTSTASFTLTVT